MASAAAVGVIERWREAYGVFFERAGMVGVMRGCSQYHATSSCVASLRRHAQMCVRMM